MKVLYFYQHFKTPAVAGGTRAYELAQRLIARGHSVTMVCGKTVDLHLPASDRPGIHRGMIDGIDVIQLDLPYSNYHGLLRRSWNFLRFAWRSILLAFREPYDLLFATSTPLTAGLPGMAIKLYRRSKPFVFEVRDLWPELPRALGMKNPILLGAMSLLEWGSYRAADAWVGLSPGICEGIVRRCRKHKPMAMIPNSCDLDIFHPRLRSELNLKGIASTNFVAVFMGAHGIANGLSAVLDAAAELVRRGRCDIVLAFIGDGKLKPDLMRRAERDRLVNCRFFDPMPKVDLARVVGSADAGLMILANVPAFYYGTSPNKFFDYIAAGLPVVNNYPGWLADMIQSQDCGLAVEPGNPAAFADALVRLADHPEDRARMGRNARRLAEQEFDRTVLGSRWVDFLEEVQRKSAGDEARA
ncbi:MAG: glycosyltransferase family 4 protein [Kiritimatiellae bacterium]|nr:glycosyltransferase family 4 protein [Kiritimatiellia bacterium]